MTCFVIECADEEMNYHEIFVEAVDREEAEIIAFDENPGIEHIYSISEVR